MKVRFHRGILEESLTTMFEPTDWNDFCRYCEKEGINTGIVRSQHYSGEDNRIGWKDTWIIFARYSVSDTVVPIGFADDDILKLREKWENKK